MRSIALRMTLALAAGVLLSAAMSELTFLFLQRNQDRAPQTIILTIPYGTAEMVAAGKTPPSIPSELEFVIGDVLEVRNLDTADHQLGALFIPVATTASLSFTEVQDFAFACSFRTDQYLGMRVREPLTWSTRIIGILSAGVPFGLLIGLYSIFAVSPARKAQPA